MYNFNNGRMSVQPPDTSIIGPQKSNNDKYKNRQTIINRTASRIDNFKAASQTLNETIFQYFA